MPGGLKLLLLHGTIFIQPITQNADVRFLRKLLGDVIRSHGGESLFERIEAIRAASVDRFRGVANPRILTAGLETLSLDETVAFVRSFMLFSMLANLAEDRQGGGGKGEHLARGAGVPERPRDRRRQ